MKKLIFGALVSVGLLSCDPCNKTICNNGGECLEAICICENGYEGENCNSLTRDNYTGTWYGNATTDGYTGALNWNVTKRPNVDELLIDGEMILKFNGSKLTFLGFVNPEIGATYSGSGTINESAINFTLTVFDGSDTYVITYKMSK